MASTAQGGSRGLVGRAARSSCAGQRWLGAWGAAPSDGEGSFSNQSLRLILTPVHGGRVARVRLSNGFGTEPLTFRSAYLGRQRSGPRLVPGSNRRLRFHGHRAVTIPPGRDALSDPVKSRFRAFEHLAVSVYVPAAAAHATEHAQAKQRSFMTASGAGDRSAQASGTGFSSVITAPLSNAARPFVSELQVRASRHEGAVVTVGDSITDGDQRKLDLTELGIDKDSRYPDLLGRRLAVHPVRRISVINEGIGGNRVLRDGFGPSLLHRLRADVLARSDVTDVILMESTNDLALSPPATADEVIHGLERAVRRLRAQRRKGPRRRINVLVGTVPPRGGNTFTTATLQARRQAVNRRIRASEIADGVVDFDRALRDPDDPLRLAARYDSGDHLHPSAAGYRRMARAVQISRLKGPTC
jgi:lysophospholipase L1-like esterase